MRYHLELRVGPHNTHIELAGDMLPAHGGNTAQLLRDVATEFEYLVATGRLREGQSVLHSALFDDVLHADIFQTGNTHVRQETRADRLTTEL